MRNRENRSKSPVRALAAGGFAALIASCLVGCASSTTGSGSADNSGLFSPPVSAVQQMNISNAFAELIRSCMTKQGFKYPTTPETLSQFITRQANVDPLYTDTLTLRSRAYGIYQAMLSGNKANVSSDPNVIYVRSLPSAMRDKDVAVLYGTKTVTFTQPDGTTGQTSAAGGCYGAANTTLYGSTTKYLEFSDYTSNLLSDIATRATWSAPWKSAQAQWTKCMAGHGFKYLTRDGAEADIAARYKVADANKSLVHDYEVKVADQDAACVDKQDMNKLSTQEMSVAAGTMTSLETNAVLTWNEMERRAATVAAKVLANG